MAISMWSPSVAIDTGEYLSRLQKSVAEATRLMEAGGWQKAEKILAEALQSFTDAGLLLEPRHEWLRMQSLLAACVFERGGFEEAIVMFQQASEARRSAGLLDWNYVRQRRYLAVAKRGLCDFSGCLEILTDALAIAKKSGMEDLRKELEGDMRVTTAIHDNAVHTAALAPTMSLVGPNGVEIMGDDRVLLRGSESLRYKCCISDYSLQVEDPCRLRLDLRFAVDNDSYISSWPDTDRYPGSQTPILFGLLLPKGARVNHGEFALEVNDPDPGWREKFFFLQNQFATMFHPSSYPPAGFYPIPRCRSYKYIRGDFSLFRTRIPAHAEVHFNGVITFHPSFQVLAKGGQVHLQTSLFLPFDTVSFNGVRVRADNTLDGVKTRIVASSFLNDRIKFNPGITPLVADDEPELGEKKELPADAGRPSVLRDLDLLSVHVVGRLAGSFALSIQPETHVIPSGIFNDMKRTERRREEGGFDVTEEAEKPVPLVSCAVVNTEGLTKKIIVEISCKDLKIHDTQVVELGAYESRILRVKPQLVEGAPLFGRQTDADLDLGPRTAVLDVSVHERRMAGIFRGMEVAHRCVELCVLPPDYMVWGIANHHDGQFVNLRMLIARWVTPQADEVKAFLDKHLIMLPEHGDRGLKDIYESLLTYEFVYDDQAVSGNSMEHNYQRVRRPVTSLAHRRVNCIDATVLLASLCERLGYQPAIVFVPRHAFLAVLFGPDLRHIERIICVESTGLCPFWSKQGSRFLFNPSTPRGRRLSYDEATYVGLAQFSENKENMFGPSGDILRCQLIPLGEARSAGITGFNAL